MIESPPLTKLLAHIIIGTDGSENGLEKNNNRNDFNVFFVLYIQMKTKKTNHRLGRSQQRRRQMKRKRA